MGILSRLQYTAESTVKTSPSGPNTPTHAIMTQSKLERVRKATETWSVFLPGRVLAAQSLGTLAEVPILTSTNISVLYQQRIARNLITSCKISPLGLLVRLEKYLRICRYSVGDEYQLSAHWPALLVHLSMWNLRVGHMLVWHDARDYMIRA